MFEPLVRADQRRWAEVYVRGLLLDGGAKSIRRTAEEVLGSTSVQSLQQFVNQSPWAWEPVRAQLAAEAHRALDSECWTIGSVAVPKRGDRTAGVDHQFALPYAHRINCQRGLGLFLSSARGTAPINWRLLLSPRWVTDHERRQYARIPTDARARADWEEVLDMMQEVQRWGLPTRPVVAEWSRSGTAEQLIRALLARDLDFLIGIDPEPGFVEMALPWPTDHGRNRGPGRASRRHLLPNRHTEGERLLLAGKPVHLRRPDPVRPAAELDLISLHYPRQGGAPSYWVTNLVHRGAETIAKLVRSWRRTGQSARGMHDDLGVRTFGGRSFPGWHHHLTLASVAATFLTVFDEKSPSLIM